MSDIDEAARMFLAAITQSYGPFELTSEQLDAVDNSVQIRYLEEANSFVVEMEGSDEDAQA
jgi:antitoxin component of RelBE/YafQ-DinJ toxin-antitoxin module